MGSGWSPTVGSLAGPTTRAGKTQAPHAKSPRSPGDLRIRDSGRWDVSAVVRALVLVRRHLTPLPVTETIEHHPTNDSVLDRSIPCIAHCHPLSRAGAGGELARLGLSPRNPRLLVFMAALACVHGSLRF